MPYCSNCGEKVEAGKNFCPNCGAPLSSPAAVPRQPEPPKVKRASRPAPVGIFIILFLALGIILLFLGGYSLFFSTLFTWDVLAFAILVFLGNGILSIVTVFGFLRGGRWASTYIALTGVCCIVGGALLSISRATSLVAIGSFAFVLGAATLLYLRFGNITAYLARREEQTETIRARE